MELALMERWHLSYADVLALPQRIAAYMLTVMEVEAQVASEMRQRQPSLGAGR